MGGIKGNLGNTPFSSQWSEHCLWGQGEPGGHWSWADQHLAGMHAPVSPQCRTRPPAVLCIIYTRVCTCVYACQCSGGDCASQSTWREICRHVDTAGLGHTFPLVPFLPAFLASFLPSVSPPPFLLSSPPFPPLFHLFLVLEMDLKHARQEPYY